MKLKSHQPIKSGSLVVQTAKSNIARDFHMHAFAIMLCACCLPLNAGSQAYLYTSLGVQTSYNPGSPATGQLDLSNYAARKIDQISLQIEGAVTSQSSYMGTYGIQWRPDPVSMTFNANIAGYQYSSLVTGMGGYGGAAVIVLVNLTCDADGVWWAQQIGFAGTLPAPGYSQTPLIGPLRLGTSPLQFQASAYAPIIPPAPGNVDSSAWAIAEGGITHSKAPDPIAVLTAPAQAGAGQEINLSIATTAPEGIGNYFTGYVLLERREDANGNVIPGFDWVQAAAAQPTSGIRNHTISITRPAMDRLGKIIYKLYPYSQVMTNEERWAVAPAEREVPIINAAPHSAGISLSASQIEYGQSVTVTGKLKDVDGNLKGHSLWVVAPVADGSKNPNWEPVSRPLSPDWWGGPINEQGWSGPWDSGRPSNASDSTVTGVFSPPRCGVWQLHTNGCDTHGAWGPGDTKDLTVVKTTPAGVLSPKSMNAYSAINETLLDAVFRNPYNLMQLPTGAITYSLTRNGNPVSFDQILEPGEYTLLATYPGDDFHTNASVQTTLNAIENANADDDNDSIPNGIEAKLGTSPNSKGVMDASALEIKILTPISTEN